MGIIKTKEKIVETERTVIDVERHDVFDPRETFLPLFRKFFFLVCVVLVFAALSKGVLPFNFLLGLAAVAAVFIFVLTIRRIFRENWDFVALVVTALILVGINVLLWT